MAEGENPSSDIALSQLAAIVASSDDAIISKSLQGIVQTWNKSAERIFGYTAEEIIGRPITLLIPPERGNEEEQILSRLKRGERVDHFETVRVRKDGRRINISVTISPIKNAAGEIVGASKVARDITHIKRIEEEREQLLDSERAARSEAERVSRVKDEFLATLSHELRTPLNAMLGWTQLLRWNRNLEGDVREGLETIERNARVQTQLISDLLDMSRIVSGKLRLDVQRLDLATVIDAAIETVRPTADAKQIHLHKVIDPRAGPVNGDPNRLQQVIWNLLNNAIKFTPKNGRVQISLQRINSHVEITVSDTGQGITPDFLPQLFARFSQADSSSTRRHGGLGLGLAIVRHLVELHGGSVRASSPGEGQGATFSVALPLSILHHKAEEDREHPEAAGLSSAAAIDLSGIKVLAVDDELDARELLRRFLEAHRAEVTTAASAAQGLEMLREARPHVVLCDIGMPGEDGYQFVQQMRALPSEQEKQIPVVALTAFARPEDRRRALLGGFQMHVSKPVDMAELLAVVASLSGRTSGRK